MHIPKVSLVFPCWHAAQHMPHVLEDLQAQTLKDFEAILVSDGDDCQLKAMEAIAAKDCRIRIVRLEKNGGVAAARNAGTDVVTSEWVTYPDPDDRLGPNYVRSLFEAVDGKNVEMACGGFRRVWVDTEETKFYYPDVNDNQEILVMAEGYEKMSISSTHRVCWNKLYSIEVIRKHDLRQDVRFKNFSDDDQFNFRYFLKVKKVSMIKNCDYVHHIYSNGLQNSSRYNPNTIQLWQELTELATAYHRQIGWSEAKVENARSQMLVIGIRNAYRNMFFLNSTLTISESVTKLQTEYFTQPEYVNLIKQGNFGKNLLLRLIQLLTRTNSAQMTAIFFSVLGFITRKLNITVN